ncbi:MAG: hypothetical protein ABSD74_04945 [Rhizomicrobium sp.]
MKYFRVPGRLANLLRAPGGVSREDALVQADSELETIRETSCAGLIELTDEIETSLASAMQQNPPTLSRTEMENILNKAEGIVSIASLFGYDDLGSVAQSLCKLVLAMQDRDLNIVDPIAVHIRAMRLVGPDSGQHPPQELETMLAELRKIFGFVAKIPKRAPALELGTSAAPARGDTHLAS